MSTSKIAVVSVLDDDPSVVEAIVSLLESVGYSAAGFSSSDEYLKSSLLGRTACLILDVRMPGIGGLELQRRLAANRDLTPIIFITAHGGHAISAEALRRGAVAFLCKPFSQESLLEAVRAALANRQDQLNVTNPINRNCAPPPGCLTTGGCCEKDAVASQAPTLTYDKSKNDVPSGVTQILQAVERGEAPFAEDLLPLVYDQLRLLAAARLAQEAAGQTLQATALVHEAWLRLVGHGERTWQNRAHFFGAASEAMRRILIENARRKSRLKRGGDLLRVDFSELNLAEATQDDKILLINESLERLQAERPEMAQVVVMKFFGGLTNQEVAVSLQVTERTVERWWAFAKAWLFRRIQEEP